MPRQPKYTRADLVSAAASSTSIAGVLRLLGVKQAGGSHANIKRRLAREGIDTSHFKGQASSKSVAPSNRMTASQILVVVKHDRREEASRLRRALLEIGRPLKCEECGLENEWNGKPITLEIDHKNCDWSDNTEGNLRFLCPNCHSQQLPCRGVRVSHGVGV